MRRSRFFCPRLLGALFAAAMLAQAAAADTPLRVSLNGEWEFSIHGRGRKPIRVPSTYYPVGGATLERTFTPPPRAPGQRSLLRFDGVAMTAEVSLNDAPLGTFGPYTPFTIDVSDRLRDGENRLRVDVSDLDGIEPWGRRWVTAFPRFGGIVRDVTLEVRPETYLANARLDYRLVDNYTRCECTLHVWLVNAGANAREIELAGALSRAGKSHAFMASVRAEPGKSECEIAFAIDDVRPWSPDSPTVYDLHLEIEAEGRQSDTFDALTGFKEFVARGRDFYLNGQKFFLKGVFRHDIYGDQGHTLTREQMEAEIADIKSLGCNYLRLGHYPHHAYIVELAARVGLLASGEPPVFGQDQTNPDVVAGAKFCLGGLIERDWNNPAAAFWAIANESGTDAGYMREMVAFVRGLDPQRLTTIVDNTRLTADNVPWPAFRQAGIDFVCQNAYGAAFDGYYERIEPLLPDDMPFVVSEWGGTVNGYDDILREGRYYLARSSRVRDDGPRIAGVSFWEYQDIPMARWTEEGLLHWSLVDVERRPYEGYYALKTLYTGQPCLPPRGRLLVPNMDQQLPRPLAAARMERYAGYEMLDLAEALNSDRAIGELGAVSPLAWPEGLATGDVAVAGLPFRLAPKLVALSRSTPSASIPVDRACSEIAFLGHVCYNSLAGPSPAGIPELPHLFEGFPNVETPVPFKGYPQAGEFGETIGDYVLAYEDGERETIPLENGVHFADYRLFFGLSRIDAVAVDTERALTYRGDHGAKSYQMRLYTHRPRHPSKKIVAIEFNLRHLDYVPLLAAVTVRVRPFE